MPFHARTPTINPDHRSLKCGAAKRGLLRPTPRSNIVPLAGETRSIYSRAIPRGNEHQAGEDRGGGRNYLHARAQPPPATHRVAVRVPDLRPVQTPPICRRAPQTHVVGRPPQRSHLAAGCGTPRRYRQTTPCCPQKVSAPSQARPNAAQTPHRPPPAHAPDPADILLRPSEPRDPWGGWRECIASTQDQACKDA